MAGESLVVLLEQAYDQFHRTGGLGEAELYSLGRQADTIVAERIGPHRLLAYVLRSVLFDLADKATGVPVTPDLAERFFGAVDLPIRAAIAALKGPLSGTRALVLAERLLDARAGVASPRA